MKKVTYPMVDAQAVETPHNPPPEKPNADPLEHENPEIDELEDNEPIEQPEIDQLEKPEREIDEIDQGDSEPEVNNLFL